MIISFTRQLYVLLKAGIPLLKALQIVHSQLSAGRFKNEIGIIVQDIEGGKSLSEAISLNPRFFSLFYINMIKAAEVSGNMVMVLKDLSEHLIKHQRITRQVQAAFMYPVLVLTMALIIVVVLLMFVLPVFMRIFEDLGGNLPGPTVFLIGISKFLQHWWSTLLVAIVIIVTASVLLYKNTSQGKRIFNLLIWRIPLFGNLSKLAEIGRFCRTIGTLLSSGVPLMKGLEVVLDTTPSVLLHRAVEDITYNVEQGKNLSLSMEETALFPLTLVKMVQVGEETGKIADLFLDAADDFEEEVSFAISGLLSIMEPLLIIIMGVIVGFIVISLFFPIFTLSNLVQ